MSSVSTSKVWSVYIVKCCDGSLYTGISNNVIKRVDAHNKGKGAKYTKRRTPVELVVTWEVGNRSEVSKEEYRVKKLSRVEKLKLIDEKNEASKKGKEES